MAVEKKDLKFNWNEIYRRLKGKIDTSGYWGTKVDGNYNCQLCNGTLLLAYLRNVDVTNAKTVVQKVYNNCGNKRYLGTATDITQNIPTLDGNPKLANRLYWGGDPNVAYDLWALSVGKYKLGMAINTIPTPSNMYANWITEIPNYVDSVDAKVLCVNKDASSYLTGFAQNQMLVNTMAFLFADEAQSIEAWRTTAVNVLSGWKTRFPTLADEKRKEPEQYYEYKREGAKENWEPKVNYLPIKVLSMLMIMYKLHSYCMISQKELATYLDWYEDRVDELSITNFTNEDCFVELLAAEMLWAQLKGCRYISSNYACGSLSKIRTEINDKRIYGNAYPLLYLAWTYWDI